VLVTAWSDRYLLATCQPDIRRMWSKAAGNLERSATKTKSIFIAGGKRMSHLVWELFVELRKEILEAQKIRAQVLGFKFTFITGAMGLIVAKLDTIDKSILVLPAFAAIFFDFIVCSISFSIKRIGCYVRDYIEPVLVKEQDIPKDFVMWQKFLTQPKTRQNLALYGNIGVTLLSVVIGIIGLLMDFRPVISLALMAALIIFMIVDVSAYFEPRKLGKMWADKDFEVVKARDLSDD
jgi:hypothetical protein